MTILGINGEKTVYHIPTCVLSRPIDSKVCSIDLSKKADVSVAEVSRIADLDNASFKLMSNIQKRK